MANPITANPEGLLIVEAEESHYRLLAELTIRAYEKVAPTLYKTGYDKELGDVASRANKVPVLAALYNGFVVGGVTFLPEPGCPYNESNLDNAASFRHLAVDPSAQSLGAGRALVTECIARAQSLGREQIAFHTMAAMTTAISMYEKMGFERAANFDRPLGEHQGLCYLLKLSDNG